MAMKINKKRFMAISIGAIATTLLLAPFVVSCSKNLNEQNEQPNLEPQPNPQPNPQPQPGPQPQPHPEESHKPAQHDGTFHAINLSAIKSATSPLSIIAKTKVFNDAVDNMYKSLNSYDWEGNGDRQFNSSEFLGKSHVADKFYELNKEVGIAGEYTYTKDIASLSESQRLNQLMQCMPSQIEVTQHDMTQRYLPTYQESEASTAIDKTSSVDLNEIIKLNQFGYLPSNLSQLLYYMDYEGIAEILNLRAEGVKDIKANYEDGKLIEGTSNRNPAFINLLVTVNSNNKYIYKLTPKNTSALKCDYDFIKYIYDRTFCLYWPKSYRTTIEHPQTSLQDKYVNIKKQGSQGTCFIIDRIKNQELEKQGKYQFLVGSNAHVLDLSPSFNKSKRLAGYNLWDPKPNVGGKSNKTYNKYWDCGWATERYSGSNVPNGINETISTVAGDNTYVKHSVINNRNPNFDYGATITTKDSDNPDIDVTNKKAQPSGITNSNFIDTIWYTPELTTKGTWTVENTNSNVGPVFDPVNPNNLEVHEKTEMGRFTGTISNAGGDFAITKLVLDREVIKKILPALDAVLDTADEANWYVGLGNVMGKSTMPSANSTLFGGGYPSSEWESIKSIGGKIITQKRYLNVNDTAGGNVVRFWEKYDRERNHKFNTYRGLVDWYDDYTNFQSPSMTLEENKKYNPHGMEIQKIMQQSLISFSNMLRHDESDVLKEGSSGSLIINSRFEPVAVNCIVANEPDKPGTSINFGMMFSNYTRDNKTFNILKQVKEKLIKEGLYTFKIRPN